MRCALLVVLAACSSHPPRTGGGAGTGATATPDAAPASGDAASSTVMTRADCERFIDHIVALQMADVRARKPADEVPTEEQVADIRATLAAELLEPCLASERAEFDCMFAAQDLAAAYACGKSEP